MTDPRVFLAANGQGQKKHPFRFLGQGYAQSRKTPGKDCPNHCGFLARCVSGNLCRGKKYSTFANVWHDALPEPRVCTKPRKSPARTARQIFSPVHFGRLVVSLAPHSAKILGSILSGVPELWDFSFAFSPCIVMQVCETKKKKKKTAKTARNTADF